MLFDTDIFIWVQRGNVRAARLIDRTPERYVSVLSFIELLQGASNRKQQRVVNDFLSSYGFVVLPLSENIGHRALVYIQEYALSHGLRAGDAIVAATATENQLTLISGNSKHFRPIKGLSFRGFRP